jgi:hypothetical protein
VNARRKRRDQGRVRSSVHPSAYVAGNEAPLIGERDARRCYYAEPGWYGARPRDAAIKAGIASLIIAIRQPSSGAFIVSLCCRSCSRSSENEDQSRSYVAPFRDRRMNSARLRKRPVPNSIAVPGSGVLPVVVSQPEMATLFVFIVTAPLLAKALPH